MNKIGDSLKKHLFAHPATYVLGSLILIGAGFLIGQLYQEQPVQNLKSQLTSIHEISKELGWREFSVKLESETQAATVYQLRPKPFFLDGMITFKIGSDGAVTIESYP